MAYDRLAPYNKIGSSLGGLFQGLYGAGAFGDTGDDRMQKRRIAAEKESLERAAALEGQAKIADFDRQQGVVNRQGFDATTADDLSRNFLNDARNQAMAGQFSPMPSSIPQFNLSQGAGAVNPEAIGRGINLAYGAQGQQQGFVNALNDMYTKATTSLPIQQAAQMAYRQGIQNEPVLNRAATDLAQTGANEAGLKNRISSSIPYQKAVEDATVHAARFAGAPKVGTGDTVVGADATIYGSMPNSSTEPMIINMPGIGPYPVPGSSITKQSMTPGGIQQNFSPAEIEAAKRSVAVQSPPTSSLAGRAGQTVSFNPAGNSSLPTAPPKQTVTPPNSQNTIAAVLEKLPSEIQQKVFQAYQANPGMTEQQVLELIKSLVPEPFTKPSREGLYGPRY